MVIPYLPWGVILRSRSKATVKGVVHYIIKTYIFTGISYDDSSMSGLVTFQLWCLSIEITATYLS